ncbi:MAG: RagB/SusD family nutrient uptake outer membrane protein [Rikenellaceae bacterium]|nr:RagB/SusD family nutrient uptake outer membrane protein [Rikenellaceae bacterium]
MKRIVKIGGVVLTSVMVSCSDYLKVDSPSKFENDYVFSKEEEIFNAIAGIYAPLCMDQTYSQAMACMYVSNTDVEFKSGSTPPSTAGNSFASFESMSNSSMINASWNALYTAIDRANTCVKGIENSDLFLEQVDNGPTNVTHMYGEAKTLRAWLYLDMIRLWGDIPFTLSESNSADSFAVGATDRNEILTYLIEDLISVEPLMKYSSDLPSGVERGNREFCQGLIARMALHRGGWTLRPDKSDPSAVGFMDRAEDWQDYYQIAEEYAWKVIDEGHHDLKLSFRDLWIEECNWNAPSGDDIVFDLPLLKSMASEFAYSIGILMSSGGINEHGLATGGNLYLACTYLVSFDP